MSTIQYFALFMGAAFIALVVFFGLLERYRQKHGEKMSGQSRLIRAAVLLASVCAVVTVAQIIDMLHFSNEDHLKSLGMR